MSFLRYGPLRSNPYRVGGRRLLDVMLPECRIPVLIRRLVLRSTRELALVLGLLAMACSGPLAPVEHALAGGDYAAASEALRRVRFRSLSGAKCTQALLYAGITLQALGDTQRARHELSRVWTRLSRRPTHLSAEQRVQLESAWRALGLAPGQASEATPGSCTGSAGG